MNTSVQLKLNLPAELQSLLKTKAGKFGVPLTQYVKYVLIKDVEQEEYPVYQASVATEEATKKALIELPNLKPVKNIHEYFKNL